MCALWSGLFGRPRLERFAPRMKQMARMKLIGQAVVRLVGKRRS